jgi:hypothetical protein
VAAAWIVRSHKLKAPRAARTVRGGRINRIKDLREIFKKYTISTFLIFVRVGLRWSNLFGTTPRSMQVCYIRAHKSAIIQLIRRPVIFWAFSSQHC